MTTHSSDAHEPEFTVERDYGYRYSDSEAPIRWGLTKEEARSAVLSHRRLYRGGQSIQIYCRERKVTEWEMIDDGIN